MLLRITLAALALVTAHTATLAQNERTSAPLAAPTGNATRGKVLYETTLRCYACHGFDGQTGSPRLVPTSRTEDMFVAYARKPATPGMPSFAATPEQDLRDIYAYVRSIPQAAPPPESVPLLKDILDRRAKAN